MEANGNCRTHTGRNRRWAAPRKTIDQCNADHGEHKPASQSRGGHGMSITSTDEAGDTARWSATCSFGAELIVREREFIDA
jgi:hypothetical protein